MAAGNTQGDRPPRMPRSEKNGIILLQLIKRDWVYMIGPVITAPIAICADVYIMASAPLFDGIVVNALFQAMGLGIFAFWARKLFLLPSHSRSAILWVLGYMSVLVYMGLLSAISGLTNLVIIPKHIDCHPSKGTVSVGVCEAARISTVFTLIACIMWMIAAIPFLMFCISDTEGVPGVDWDSDDDDEPAATNTPSDDNDSDVDGAVADAHTKTDSGLPSQPGIRRAFTIAPSQF